MNDFKKNKLPVVLVLSFIICILGIVIFLFFVDNNYFMMEENEDLIDIIYQCSLNDNEIDFDKIFDEEWDEMIVIEPYSTPKDLYKNFKWNKINTSIEYRDDINLIVFLKNKKIISYLNYPMIKGNFLDYGVFKRDSARFKVELSSSDDFTNFKHILQ